MEHYHNWNKDSVRKMERPENDGDHDYDEQVVALISL